MIYYRQRGMGEMKYLCLKLQTPKRGLMLKPDHIKIKFAPQWPYSLGGFLHAPLCFSFRSADVQSKILWAKRELKAILQQ